MDDKIRIINIIILLKRDAVYNEICIMIKKILYIVWVRVRGSFRVGLFKKFNKFDLV
jgi:hypothetical protein